MTQPLTITRPTHDTDLYDLNRRLLSVPAGEPLHVALEPGEYPLHPARAAETFAFISNNDEGLKRVAFHVTDRDEVVVDGHGAQLRTRGAVIPFLIERCRNVTLRNFTLDADVPFHAEATVLAVHADGVDVEIPPAFPCTLEDGRLRFPMPGHTPWEVDNILEFDPRRRETAFMARDNYGIGRRMRVAEAGPRRYRLIAQFSAPRPQVGNVLVLSGFGRYCPAVVLSECRNVVVENVTLHQAGGMGVIAQRCHDVRLENVRVTPSDGRVVSLVADATHFVGCSGKVVIERCVFENQLDDPVNVHGVYTTITARPSPNSLEVKLNHIQQLGLTTADAGDRLELVRSTTLLTYHEGTVASVERINKEYSVVTFAEPLPAGVNLGDAVGNLTKTPDVTIRGCRSRGNRARGFLLTTPGRVLVEDNYFHTPGPAILITGDANHWFESGAVRDVTIRGNTFDNCNYGVWGTGAIEFHPEVAPEHRGEKPYHRNVVIEDNTFTAFDPRCVVGWGVEGLRIRRNVVIPSDAYPCPDIAVDSPYDLSHCTDLAIDSSPAAIRDAGELPARRLEVTVAAGKGAPRLANTGSR